MIISKYIDGKYYIEVSNYYKILLKLEKTNEKIEKLEAELFDAKKSADEYYNKCIDLTNQIEKLESELESKGSEIERLKKRIGKLASIRVRCHESARDSFDLGNYGSLHIVTADELKTTKDKNDRTVELQFDPLETANILINATYKAEIPFLEKQVDRNVYNIEDLEQIAEHLLVYCKHNREDEE